MRYLKDINSDLILKAIEFSVGKHDGQKRKGTGLPYFVHPFSTMILLMKYKSDSKNVESLIVAALLHDTLEDTKCSYYEIEQEFNSMIASIVLELTSNKKLIKKMGKNEYLIQKMIGMSKYALTIKLVDRLANIKDKPSLKYAKDTTVLLEELSKNRELNKTQYYIILDIEGEILKIEDEV